MRRWSRSWPAPSACVSRCSRGMRRSGRRCGRCWRRPRARRGLAADALAIGAGSITARDYHAVQILAIRREDGRMAELDAGVRRLAESNADRPAWRAALAMLEWESGRAEEAQRHIDVLSDRGFANVPLDGDWLTTMALAADVCAGLGDEATAAIIHEQLLPYAQANVVIGLGAACLGSVATSRAGWRRRSGESARRPICSNRAWRRTPRCVRRFASRAPSSSTPARSVRGVAGRSWSPARSGQRGAGPRKAHA